MVEDSSEWSHKLTDEERIIAFGESNVNAQLCFADTDDETCSNETSSK